MEALEQEVYDELPEVQATTGPCNLTRSIYEVISEGSCPDEMIMVMHDWEKISTSKWLLSYRNDKRNWRLSNQHNLADIINGEAPTTSGSITLAPGKTGNAAKFPGGIAHAAYTPYSLTAEKELSACAWVYLNSMNAYNAIVGARSTAGDMSRFLDIENNMFKFYTTAAVSYTFGSGITASQFYHSAVTVDAARTLKAYMNGQLVLTRSNVTLSTAQPTYLMVGNLYPGFATGTNGLIDGVRIYDKALTQDIIQQMYAKGI